MIKISFTNFLGISGSLTCDSVASARRVLDALAGEPAPELPVVTVPENSVVTALEMQPGDVARLSAGNELNDCYTYRVAFPGGWVIGLDDADQFDIDRALTWSPDEGTYCKVGTIQIDDLQYVSDLSRPGCPQRRVIASVVWHRVQELLGYFKKNLV